MRPTHFFRNSQQRLAKQARIKIIFGGDSVAVSRIRKFLKRYDLVLVLDNPGDLQCLCEQIESPNLIPIALGEGETAKSIVQEAPEDLRTCVNALAGMNAANGMGQARKLCYWATHNFLQSPAFQAIVDGTIIPALLARGVSLSQLSLEGAGGGSGGTASDGLILFIAALADTLEERLGVIVNVELRFTGAVTSADLGPYTRLNAAANIVEATKYVTDSRQSMRQTRSLAFRELPPVGTDRKLRDRFVQTFEQAVAATEVEQFLGPQAPNRSLTGKCGNITKLIADYYTALDLRQDVGADISQTLGKELLAVLESPVQPVVSEVRVLTRENVLPQEPAESLAEQAWEVDANELMSAILQPGLAIQASVIAELLTGTDLELDELHHHLAVPPKTATTAAERLSLLRACLRAMARPIRDYAAREAKLHARMNRAERALRRALQLFNPQTIWQRIQAAAISDATKVARLIDRIERFWTWRDDWLRVAVPLEALLAAEQLVKNELDFLEQRLIAMQATLARFELRGQARRKVRYVISERLDEVFHDLWKLSPTATDDQVLPILAAAVRQVTLDGLAKIVGAAEPRADEVARRIGGRHVSVSGPAWGGCERPPPSICLHVLPPIEPALAETLRSLISSIDGSTVCIADIAAAAVNVVDLHVTWVNLVEELFPGFYRHSLKSIFRSPNRPFS